MVSAGEHHVDRRPLPPPLFLRRPLRADRHPRPRRVHLRVGRHAAPRRLHILPPLTRGACSRRRASHGVNMYVRVPAHHPDLPHHMPNRRGGSPRCTRGIGYVHLGVGVSHLHHLLTWRSARFLIIVISMTSTTGVAGTRHNPDGRAARSGRRRRGALAAGLEGRHRHPNGLVQGRLQGTQPNHKRSTINLHSFSNHSPLQTPTNSRATCPPRSSSSSSA